MGKIKDATPRLPITPVDESTLKKLKDAMQGLEMI